MGYNGLQYDQNPSPTRAFLEADEALSFLCGSDDQDIEVTTTGFISLPMLTLGIQLIRSRRVGVIAFELCGDLLHSFRASINFEEKKPIHATLPERKHKA